MNYVSIIVPSRGEDEATFRRCIESLLNQVGTNVHLIVSTIAGDACLNWLDYDADIDKVITQPEDAPERSPVGSFFQIKQAIPMLKHEYMFYHSSNDIVKSDKCINEIAAIESNPGKKVCYSSFVICDQHMENQRVKKFPEEYTLERHLQSNFVYDSSMVETNLFLKYMPFTELYNCGYWDLWLRIYAGEGNVFVYNDKPVKYYIQHTDSMHIKRKPGSKEYIRHATDREIMLNFHKNNFYGKKN